MTPTPSDKSSKGGDWSGGGEKVNEQGQQSEKGDGGKGEELQHLMKSLDIAEHLHVLQVIIITLSYVTLHHRHMRLHGLRLITMSRLVSVRHQETLQNVLMYTSSACPIRISLLWVSAQPKKIRFVIIFLYLVHKCEYMKILSDITEFLSFRSMY